MDDSLLAASTWQAFVDGWDIEQRREIARAKSPQRIDMSKVRMKMSDGGQYYANSNSVVDPVSGVPIVGS